MVYWNLWSEQHGEDARAFLVPDHSHTGCGPTNLCWPEQCCLVGNLLSLEFGVLNTELPLVVRV